MPEDGLSKVETCITHVKAQFESK